MGPGERRRRFEVELQDQESAEDPPDGVVVIGEARRDQVRAESSYEVSHGIAGHARGGDPFEVIGARRSGARPVQYVLVRSAYSLPRPLSGDGQLVALLRHILPPAARNLSGNVLKRALLGGERDFAFRLDLENRDAS